MILDRLVLDSCDILVYIMILVIERILKDNSCSINILTSNDFYIDQELCLEQSKLKKIMNESLKLIK
jgi:hypothetical protein